LTQRHIQEVRPARASRDGDNVAIQRVLGMQHAAMDPILMIDELYAEHRKDFSGGFPPHPHKGMQTLTYMKSGGIIHQDSQGNRGEIRGGGAQWMSAGRGIIHSEMPTQDSTGLHGFQLWINLPRAEKTGAPDYRDVPAAELTRHRGPDYELVALAGEWRLGEATTIGPLNRLARQAAIADLILHPGARLVLPTTATESVLAYVYRGSLLLEAAEYGAQQLLVSSPGETWDLQAGPGGAELLLLRGEPLREPVAHYGPFVMNTPEEIEQAIRDYQTGRLVS
jgi:redox-sensitive bicupin YhaK (pirin superfamily)